MEASQTAIRKGQGRDGLLGLRESIQDTVEMMPRRAMRGAYRSQVVLYLYSYSVDALHEVVLRVMSSMQTAC